ncbi:hypothetical protein TNCV_2556361 [Trichonephila clavipes]|nr:hypothetical protein TNCV_2556361 [Trichonephila clavipes]
MSGLKVPKSYGILRRNYQSECNKLFIRGLDIPLTVFGSSPIGRTCMHYSTIAEDRYTCNTDFISKDVDATTKGAVRTLVNLNQSRPGSHRFAM